MILLLDFIRTMGAMNLELLLHATGVKSVAYAENFHGGVIQWHIVSICILCALFVTSQFDVIFMVSSEVCWHNRHILLHALPLFLQKSSPIHSPYNKVFVNIKHKGGGSPQTPLLAYALEWNGRTTRTACSTLHQKNLFCAIHRLTRFSRHTS